MDEGRAYDWNDEIKNDGGDFVLLDPGDYDFTVLRFERARHNGSDKLPPCNKAIITIGIKQPDGVTVELTHNLFLHQRTEALLSAFFRAIGQKKHGEPLRMDWSKVVGSTGRCKVEQREYTGNDGEIRKTNNIKKFYDKEAPAPRAFTPGEF